MNSTSRTPKQLGTALRRYRKKSGHSQADVSARIGKRQATISHLESEGGGTLETLFAVLSALDLELVLRPRSKGESVTLGDIF